MSGTIFNQREKLSAPPFITVPVEDEEIKRKIFKSWSQLRSCAMAEKSATFSAEGELLKAFVIRKGTQLRLEKALMLTRRILTLVTRWKSNSCWVDFSKFKDAFEEAGGGETGRRTPKRKGEVEARQSKMMKHVKSSVSLKGVRLPSRQWSNWVIYLTLRDLLLLSKIKYECERTVGYWLGLISCSHHPADSLIVVGILYRIWAVSSGMVEDYANQVYPSLCFISSLLSPTKADNWLQDIDFPNDLLTWLEKILGFPFQPATICGYEQMFRRDGGGAVAGKMDKILGGAASQTPQEDKKSFRADTPSTSSRVRDMGPNCNEEEEDFGVPVKVQEELSQQKKLGKKKKVGAAAQSRKKIALNERWTKFFQNFKAKLETEGGRRQLLTRVKKFKKTEADPEITARLQKVFKLVKGDKRDKLLLYIPKFKTFLARKCE